nr:nesprin-2 [Anolis sagrei ordinatus]
MESTKISPSEEEQSSMDIDDLHYSLQAEQENTQKKTFTSWINSQLEKHSPPSFILDLYADVGRGHSLLDLLEVLSGEQLPREKGSNTFQCRSNIENALTFLKNRSIKLINIHVADIVEGKPSIVLGLIWTIILHFQIEELAWTLAGGYSHPSVETPSATDNTSPTESPPAKRNAKAKERWKISAKKALLLWAKEQCAKHGFISVADFKSSWRNGLAFLAVIHALRPGLVDVEKAKGRSNQENLKEAFDLAEKELNIPRLLEPEDVDVTNPDEKSIMTYVAQFLQYFKSLPSAEEEVQGKANETLSWLEAQEKKLTELQTETDNAPFYEKYKEMMSFMETFDEEKKAFLPVLTSKRKALELSEDQLQMGEAWDSLSSQIDEWKGKLDHLLPPPLDTIELWLQDVEQQMAEDLPDSHHRCKAVDVLQGRMKSLQGLMSYFDQHLETLLSFENRDEIGMPLVPHQKLEEIKKRFSNIQMTDYSILVEYYNLFCSAILEELISKLNIWHIKYGTKEEVESLLSDWQDFIEEKEFVGQLEAAFQTCEKKKNRLIRTSVLGVDPDDINKQFKMLESQISRCKEYIYNVNETLQKKLSSWAIYTENIQLLKEWLEKTRKEHPKKVPTETLAAWNSRHGSLNEAGNFLIECSNEEVGSVVSAELKKLNTKWAKLIKKTQFEMRLLRMQQEEMCLLSDNENADSPPVKTEIGMPGQQVNVSDEALESQVESMKVLPVAPCSDSIAPEASEAFLLQQEIKLNFEDSHKKLEATVLKAMQLVCREKGPERSMSKYEEAFSILDAGILGEFLKAAEQLKDVSATHDKTVVEEKSKDVRERWEAARREIISYIQFKMEFERGQLNKMFTKLNKQINKEKRLLNAGRTKGLLEEHEDMFSQQGRMGKLNTCLQAMKMMSEKIAIEENESETKMLVAEYEQRKEDLQKRASAVYNALVSRACEDLSSKKGGKTLASANGEKASSQSAYDGLSAEKDPPSISSIKMEAKEKIHNGKHHAKKSRKDESLDLEVLKESYDRARHKLKLHLSSVRENIVPAFTADIKDASCLQNKLNELEALESQSESSWKVLESMSTMLEKSSGEMGKPDAFEQSQEELCREWKELQSTLNKRMESLKAVLALVLPIENELVQLCSSEEQLRKRDIPQGLLMNKDLPHKKVKKMQASIVKCIGWCNQKEQSNPTGGTVDPADWQAASAMISQYKMQLEELGHKIQTVEAVLQDLETFLPYLRKVSGPVEASDPLSHPQQLLVQQEVWKMQKEARSLDDRLTRARIRLEDPDSGKKMTFKELVATFCAKEFPTASSAETLEVAQNQDMPSQVDQNQEEFSLKNSELYKSIQEIRDKMCKIGLRDPTIHAVQQRLKSLAELKQTFDRHIADMASLSELASHLSQKELKHQWRRTEDLWKEIKLSIAEKLEHCGRVMELLKNYHSCKNGLMSIILKQEHVLSQQASYMGKANLQRITAKVNKAKQEFNSHSEDVDRINQICKNLQSQLNKIKTFEEPPFENEANAIVDRWLDVNERTENYCDNLGRALALWDKLLNLSGLIEEWSNAQLKNLEEDGSPTEKELAQLEAGLEFQEKNLEEFDTKVAEIQHLLNGSEPSLELQVIKSSLLNKMERIRKHLPSKSIPAELNGNTAELKGDLDLAKTQIGMTESLLKALSPSDTLEIFTKLEDLHHKILQQKHHVESLQKGPGYLNPEVAELQEQLKSVTDLFNSKKQIFQDHFTTLLNYQCKNFDEWFSSTQLSLEECFETSETKEMLEEKIQQLRSFLTSEGKDRDIQEVKTLLSQVKHYLPKATVRQLSSWVRDKDVALQKVTSRCQAQEEELSNSLQRFARLEDDCSNLTEWLHLQELQESQLEKPEFEHFYLTLLKKRESFDFLAWLINSLRSSGFTCDEVVLESAQLVNKYKMLLGHVRKNLAVSKVLSAEGKNFEDLAQNVFSWVQKVNESVLTLSSEDSKTPLEEKLRQIKEIVLLKEEGNAKLENVAALGENVKGASGNKNEAIQQMLSDVQNQWESTIRLATECLRHQEQLQHQRKQQRRKKEDAGAVPCDSETQNQEISLDLYLDSEEMQSQLSNYSALQEEAEDLTLLLNELARQHSSFGVFTGDSFSEESLMALQQLHGSLVNRLQSTAILLEGHVEEYQRCKELMTHLRATLNELWDPNDEEPKQIPQDTLCQIEDTLQGIIAAVEVLKEEMCNKDEMDAPHSIYNKHLKIKVGYIEEETVNVLNDAAKQNNSFSDDEQTQETTDELFFDAEENNAMEVQGRISVSGVEIVPQKNLLPEDKILTEYAEMEQKVNEMKLRTAELDIVLVNDHLKEIESLCAHLEKQKAEALSLLQGEHVKAGGSSKSDPQHVASSKWDKLLQDLMTVKKAKEEQLHLVNNYQECFATVQASMKRFSTEKENLKIRGPMEDTVLLENIKKCLTSIEDERVLLNKLKTEQESLSRHLTKMDKALIESQVDQVERWWQQMEDSLQKKQLWVSAEADEFKLFTDKIQDLQNQLQGQHRLRTGLDAPNGGDSVCLALMGPELQMLKHSVSVLRRGIDMQMKRIWSDAGKTALESRINDLQNQVDELEQLTPKEEVQMMGNYSHRPEIAKKIEEAILWARVLELQLDEKAALFPGELMLQIQSFQALINVAKERESVVMKLVEEAHLVAPQLAPREFSALGILARELQTCHRRLVLKLVQKVQQLKPQFEKRQKLFADVEKVQSQLCKAESMSRLDAGEASVESEMEPWQVISEELSQDIQETEGLVDANCKDPPQGLKIFEHLFLSDCLQSFRSRAKRALRLIQIKDYTVQNKIDTCEKFSDKIMALQRDLSSLCLQCNELELDQKKLFPMNQKFKSKWNALRERAISFLECLTSLDRYKEIWEFLDLNWDASCLGELQSQLCKMKIHLDHRVKCFESFCTEYDRHQTALNEAETILSKIQRDCDALKDCSDVTSETNLIPEKIWSWRVQHAKRLTQEALRLLDTNESLSISLKEAKMQEIKSLGAKIEGVTQMIQSRILAAQEKCQPEQGLQSIVNHSLVTLKQIQSELQPPLLLDLEIQMIPCEKMYCKVLEDAAEAEYCAVEEILKRESEEEKSPLLDILGTELETLRNLKEELKSDIAARRDAIDKAFGTVRCYSEAVQKAVDLFHQCEDLLSSPKLSLDELEKESLLPILQKQEQFEAVKTEVEALTSVLEKQVKPRANLHLQKTLGELVAGSLIVGEKAQKRRSDLTRCLEKYQHFKKSKDAICADLNDVKKVLQKALGHIPVSYKEALELSEQSKMQVSCLVSTEEDLMKLRQDSGHLGLMCKENDGVLMGTVASTLWLKWLYLLNAAKEWEGTCEEQSQEWKSISEEMERETIILDNLQDELPENPKEKESATKEELEEFMDCANYYKESLDAEKLLLRLILQRLRSILGVPESPPGKKEDIPVVHEIQAMQERIKEIREKVQKQKDAVQLEKEDRAKVNEEIHAVKSSLENIFSLLHSVDGETLNEKTAKLEEIRRVIGPRKQTLERIMEKLRIKYADMYTIVPVEIETHLEDCKETLKDLEEKVSDELLKNSPRYITDKKIEDINKGLQAVENMLQQKSEGIEKAKGIQKRIWDLLDLWHYKMNELDAEVQDIIEQDPCQAQDLMDRLMIPLQQYQRVSQLAERRTTNLNRAASKMEECDELLKSTRAWIESTNNLLTEECKGDSAKTLNKYATSLQIAFEDSEQKETLLSAIYPELEELSTLVETDALLRELNNVGKEVKALQEKIMGILPHIQHLADEVEAVESEVKKMEKDVDKIKTILSPSEDTLDFSPKEHLKHGQVILVHISSMQNKLMDIQSFEENLKLPNMKMQPLCVFQRMKQLLKELKRLERITKAQNTLLEPIVKEVEANEQETDCVKQLLFPKSDLGELSAESPWPGEAASPKEGMEMEEIQQRITILCQKKEDILMSMKNSLMELHKQQEQPELEDDTEESQEPEENGEGAEWQPKKRGSASLLPSLAEEAEDNSFHSSQGDADEPRDMHIKPDQENNSLFFQRKGNEEERRGNQTKGKPSTEVTNIPECFWTSLQESKETVDSDGPESDPAQVLHVCQAQIAELEMWIKQAKESLGSEAQTGQMQQAVEQRLAACQIMLSEIEQKVACLLENCKDRPASDCPNLQEEAESLSLKLRDVKLSLEKVQGMLQDKHAEEEVSFGEKTSENSSQHLCFGLSSIFPLISSDRPVLSKTNGLQHQQELFSELSEQSNLIDFIEVYVGKMQPQSEHSTILELQPSHEAPVSKDEPSILTPKDQTGDKWQYLQEQLLCKKSPLHFELIEPQISTKINILPKGATSSVRTPTVEELKRYTAELGSLSQIQENVAGDVSLSLDQKLFELLLAISRCLNNMEQMLSTCALTSEEAPMQQILYETLSAELQKLHADIGDKKEDLLKSITSAGGNPERFSQCFSNLQAWLQQTEAATASRSKCMKTDLDRYSFYQNEIRELYDELIKKKSMMQQSFGATSSHDISTMLQITNNYELELQNFETRTAKLRDHGEKLPLPVALVHEVDKLEEVLDDLWKILRAKQRELTSPLISEQQYEALLQGLTELTNLGREKVIQISSLKATSQTNLQFHLKNHKSFFCNLKTHMLRVQMCSQKVAPSVLQEREKSWKEMEKNINSLEQQAIQQGTCLEMLLQDWIEFDENYVSFCQKLEALSSEVPSVSLVEGTEERLMERTQLLQQIKKNIEKEKARYGQLVKEGKDLMELVKCPELEGQVGNLQEQWASLSQKVGHELQRLDSLLRLLSSYNRESKDLDRWLAVAQQRVNDWNEQSLDASQELSTVRDNIQSLLEFTKEIAEKYSLMSSVLSTGNQLLLLKESDAAVLRSSLTEYEQKWADLTSQLPGIQEKFHQLQMAKLPSHEAITELTAWMNHIDQQKSNKATIDLQSSAAQVKGLLKEYKEYLLEMNFKQWVVDYVNQSLLQMTTCDVESKRYERTAFAERLGEMNLQWHNLQGALNEKIKELEHILECVTENESKAQSLGSWLEAQSRQLNEAVKPASSLFARDTSEVCKVVENELAAKSKDVDHLKQMYALVEHNTEASEKPALDINHLAELRANVANQLVQLKTSTQSALENWRIYDEVWREVRQMLARALYYSEHSKPSVITFDTVKNQVADLQGLQDKTENNEEIWARLQAAVANLKKLCDPLFLQLIEHKNQKARTRWALINKEIEDQLQKAQTYLPLWKSYVDLYAEVSAKLDKHEEQCNSLWAVNIPAGCTRDFLNEKSQDVKVGPWHCNKIWLIITDTEVAWLEGFGSYKCNPTFTELTEVVKARPQGVIGRRHLRDTPLKGEFTKEIAEKYSLMSSVLSTGNQLLLLKESDAAVLRSSLTEYEQKWADLTSQLPGIQEKFHQLQMAKLPSHEAITELTAWMNHIDQQKSNKATIDLQSSAAQVKGLLKEYKEYLLEMNFKQWVVDYVNQSLLQMTTCDVESKRYERTAFAERLGEMNLQWHNLQGALNEKIKELEHILECVTENESKAQSLGSWLEAQSRQLNEAVKPASSLFARDTSEVCKVVENELAAKSKDVDHLKQMYALVEHNTEASEKPALDINHLAELRANVANQLVQLKTSTQSALENWRIYDEVWREVRQMLARALYYSEHSKPSVITFDTVKNQVADLQGLQDKTENNEEIWARLQAAVANLKKLCDPLFLQLIEHKNQKARTRWALINKEIEDQLQKAQTYLPLWKSYVDLYAEVSAKLDKHEEQCNSLWAVNIPAGCTRDFLNEKSQDVKKLQLGLQNIKRSSLQVSELADQITQLVAPTSQPLLLEKLQPLQRASRLERMLQMKASEFQFALLQLESFEKCLEKLENHLKVYTEAQDQLNQEDNSSDRLMSQMLGLTALTPEMETLNEVSFKLPLSDVTAKRLQSLNWQWSQKTAMVLEQCSELQTIQADDKGFLQQCQNWVHFLERMKEGLKENVAGTHEGLKEQQREYEILQAEISVHQQIFNCIMSKALQMLESGEAENRTEFISKLTVLKEQWQSVVHMAQKRKSQIDALVKQWQKFTTLSQDLARFLTDTNGLIAATKSQDKYSLDQVRNLSHDFKNTQILLRRWQSRYSLALDTGGNLLGVAAPEAKAAVQREMSHLQENWGNTQLQVEKMTKQLQSTIETWENCEKQVEELSHNLQKLKAEVKNPLPEEHDELQATKEHIKDLEQSLANWNQRAKELGTRKADLAHYLLAEDVMVLKEQVQHLHRQWEELCLRVSLRKQEIEDRLNAWIVFNEKNKELCSWLVQMESKVLQSGDISIEDMIDKLEKDCMEEINMFSENKLVPLKQMGDQLIKDSNKSRVAEIDEKLNKINDRWQHLFDVIGGRVKKLKETFTFIQQLDKNMSNLRTWLARIESELSKPVVYDICDDQEIQKRLAEQQDLQRDIEQHSAGVESVFSICEVLLHDSDACANETECDSIQQTTRSLDRRWRNICAMSMERRMKIEETWCLWQRFLEDYSRFEDWLKTAEKTAAYPNSSEVAYTNAKEELKKFEAFQRQIHERLTQLELINKQYRRLARENRTDSASKLKQMVHEGNQRWDNLQRRVAAILRRLKLFTNQWEEFVGTKDSVLVWLTEMDLQLTNVEHFSESNFDDKMRQLNGFQQEIMLNAKKIDQLTEFGEHLIQKSEPSDAVVIEEELEELHKYCQDVFGRVSRFHQRLANWHSGVEYEKESSENKADAEDSRGLQHDPWHKKALPDVPPPQQSLCHLMPPAMGHERSGCETPVSVDSIPLEWDHTGDVGGSSSPEDEEEEPYYSALSDVEIPEHPEAYLKMTTKALRTASAGTSASETHTWHSPESPACRKHPYNQREMVRSVLTNSPETSTPYKPGYGKQLSTGSIDSIKEIPGILPTEDAQGSQNIIGVAAVEKQPGSMERWELLQAQDLSNKLRMKQNLQQWQQLNSDLTTINAWLDTMEEELEGLQEAGPANSIEVIEQRVKKLKDMLKAFDNYKALVLSVNLTSKDFKQVDSTGSKELQNRLRQVNFRWEKASLLMGNWRKSLQEALMHCQDFHEMNQKLLLWLACAETRRHHAQVKDANADPHIIQESRKELMQLEKELLERQLQVNTLQEISTHLLDKSGGDYAEADEKVHVIGKKLKQLLEGVSQDLKVSQGSQDISAFQTQGSEVDSGRYHQLSEKPSTYRHKGDRRKSLENKISSNIRTEDGDEARPAAPKTLSFFYRVLRAALPLQLLFLLLLLLASLIPFSEEDYSCTHANNFARSFYPMLRYINGPPPT